MGDTLSADGGSMISELGTLFKILANPDRIMIVQMLADHDELSVNELAEKVGVSPSRTSRHLHVLRCFRLVDNSSMGHYRFYSLNRNELADWLLQGVSFIRYFDNTERGR